MSAAQAVKDARASGIQLGVEGDDLVLEAAAPPTALLHQLSRHKASVIALLRDEKDGWSAEEWVAFFDERAGSAEYDGGQTRVHAEVRAFESCINRWMIENPARSEPGHCLWCGGANRDQSMLIPFGISETNAAWLHPDCWKPWRQDRRQQAIERLHALGLELTLKIEPNKEGDHV